MWKPMGDPQDYNECHRTAHRDPKTVRRYQEDRVWNGQRAPFCFSLFEKPGQSTIFLSRVRQSANHDQNYKQRINPNVNQKTHEKVQQQNTKKEVQKDYQVLTRSLSKH
jgi:hypothetical protein